MSDDDRWHFACCGAEIVNERAIEELSLFVVDHLLEKRHAQAVRHSSQNLTFSQFGVQESTGVMDGDIIKESDLRCFGVNSNFHYINEKPIGSRGIYSVLLIRRHHCWNRVVAGLKYSRLNACRKLCRIPVCESCKAFEGKFRIAITMIHTPCPHREFSFRHV